MSERHGTAVSTLWRYNVRISGRYVVSLVGNLSCLSRYMRQEQSLFVSRLFHRRTTENGLCVEFNLVKGVFRKITFITQFHTIFKDVVVRPNLTVHYQYCSML